MRTTPFHHTLGRALHCRLAWGAALSLLAANGAAQTALTDSVHSIAEVTVAAPPSFLETIPSQKLQGEELTRLNSRTVADALRFFAGVQIKDYGGVGGIKTINIRSMGTNHVGVFYDGVQLSNAQNGQVDLGMFSLDNISSISVHNGQKSDIFQSARDFNTAGTVYMWSRRPEFAPGRQAAVRLTFKTGSFDLINPAATADVKLSGRVAASFSAEHLRSSGEYTFRYRRQNPQTGATVYDTTAVRHNGDINATRVEAALYGRTGAAEWSARLYNYTSDRGVPGAIVNNVWRRGERIEDNNSFAQGTLTLTPKGRYALRALAKYASYRTHYENRDTSIVTIDNHYYQQEAYLSAANLVSISPLWAASLSADAQWNTMTADLYGFAEPTRWTVMASAATSLSAGNFRAQASAVLTYVTDHTVRTAAPADKRVLTPAAALSYRPAAGPVTLRAFAKKSFRMPTFNDLYYADMGNSKLNPESTIQYDAGAALSHKTGSWLQALEIQADAYYNLVKDKIVAYPKGAQFRWTMINLGRVEIKGLDVSASAAISPAERLTLTAKAQYTFQQALDVTSRDDSFYRDQIPYVARHSGSAALLSRWGEWGLDCSFIYTGERYSQQENIVYNYVQPWYTTDVSALRDIALPRGAGSLRLQVEVNNLLDQDYDVIINYPMPGRNVRVTARYTL